MTYRLHSDAIVMTNLRVASTYIVGTCAITLITIGRGRVGSRKTLAKIGNDMQT